jgi:hypothetical protein
MYHLNEEIEHIYESNMNTSMEETNELKAELVQKDQQIQLLTSTLQKQYEKNTIQNVSSTFETENKNNKAYRRRIYGIFSKYSALHHKSVHYVKKILNIIFNIYV